MDKIVQLQNIIDNSKSIVFFTGAGVSTESGIPDFRSVDGLYNTKYQYPPERIISHSFFEYNPQEFYRFYKDKMIYPLAKCNQAHIKMAQLEKAGKCIGVVTQNIDGLHQQAGSKKVFELHGSIHRNYCQKCGKFHSLDEIVNCKELPLCQCGGLIKPDVVLYEEPLDDDVVYQAINAIRKADCLIITGTSLVVYPAAGLINYFNGKNLVVINMSPTSADQNAQLCIEGRVGEILSQIKIK